MLIHHRSGFQWSFLPRRSSRKQPNPLDACSIIKRNPMKQTFHANYCAPFTAVLALLLLAQGCSTPTKNKTVSDALPRPEAKVVIGDITNQTGKTFEFPVEQEFRTALAKELHKQDLLAAATPQPRDFMLNLNLT